MCQKKIMRKRSSENIIEEPPKKRISPGGNLLPAQIPPGEVLTDITAKQWKLGKPVGLGGFGEIYLASDNLKENVKQDAPYVIKVENHSNGPLFVEINCLLRIARLNMINDWKKEKNLKSFGMPHYIASGSHVTTNEKIRFLVLPRYERDLESIFLSKNKKFNLKTVINICTQIMDILDYIHTKGYVHCDIKASNILYSLHKVTTTKRKKLVTCSSKANPVRTCRIKRVRKHERNLRDIKVLNYNDEDIDESDFFESSDEESSVETCNQVYLIDYGLATKFRNSDGTHKEYCLDERKAHAGTILFCSLDAHLGVSSRRSDLETLGYNMIYWLTSDLPWSKYINNPETVQKKKEECLSNLDIFLKSCFTNCPTFIYEYFEYVKSLSYESKPDYTYCKKLFQDALSQYGYSKDGQFDFNNEEGWGQQSKGTKPRKLSEPKKTKQRRVPLTSNILVENKVPRLRKNAKNDKKKVNWSRILLDPEVILREKNKQTKSTEVLKTNKTREKKLSESNDSCISNSVQNLDIWALNPTYAMIEVFNKSRDKNANTNCTGQQTKNGKNGTHYASRIGYTPAMNMILSKMYMNNLTEMQKPKDGAMVSVNVIVRHTRSHTNKKKATTELSKRPKTTVTKETKRRPKSPRIRGYGLRG